MSSELSELDFQQQCPDWCLDHQPDDVDHLRHVAGLSALTAGVDAPIDVYLLQEPSQRTQIEVVCPHKAWPQSIHLPVSQARSLAAALLRAADLAEHTHSSAQR